MSGKMESVRLFSDIEKLINNKIFGKPKIINSSINFNGNNNILYCEDNVELFNTNINFNGEYSLIYLSSSKTKYSLNIMISNGSTVFIGKDNKMVPPIYINVQENQNVIIGDDCSIGSNVQIRTADAHPIYCSCDKRRINFSKSVYIGDHVCIGHMAYISKGVEVGSGAIIDNNSFVSSNTKIKSNTLNMGNPSKVIREDVFFLNEYVGLYNAEETLNSEYYKSNVFNYEVINKETLNMNRIDEILKDLNIGERLEFIKKLFVENKRKNRFSLKY